MSERAQREQQALRYFVGMGWTPAQAAGIVANLLAESGLDPAVVGDGGSAFGLAQWHPDRQAGFRALIGKDIRGSSFEDQLAYVHAELQGTEQAAGDALRACTTAAAAGATVSAKYERPADREGEATKRAALAEDLLAAYAPAQDRPGEAIATAPLPYPASPSSEAPMPLFALLSTLLPTVLQLFQPRVAAPIQKLTGQDADTAMPLLLDLFSKIAQTFGVVPAGQQITTPAQAVQAAAAVQTATPEQIKEIEQHALDYLDKVAPMLDRLAQYDAAQWRAAMEGRDAASARAARDRTDLGPFLAKVTAAIALLVVVASIGAVAAQVALTSDHEPTVGLIGLVGPLITLALKLFADVVAYRFDGTPTSNAANAANAAIAAALPAPRRDA